MGGGRIRITVGQSTKQADLDDDWIMTHEMFHLGFPDVPDRYNWMEEGLSTYLEPIARVRVGHLTPERIWTDMFEGMPRGLPKAGDRGLDNTPTHGRIYWGGCLFWLTADIDIRKRTEGRKSLDDAIRAILDAGGDGSADWPVERVISVGDEATGTTVLKDLHERMGPQAEQTDLDALWRDLGVVYRRGGGGVRRQGAARVGPQGDRDPAGDTRDTPDQPSRRMRRKLRPAGLRRTVDTCGSPIATGSDKSRCIPPHQRAGQTSARFEKYPLATVTSAFARPRVPLGVMSFTGGERARYGSHRN